jgi:diguanylate cyclase
MFEELDPQYAAAIAERTNRLMIQHGVPQTPANYSVWFSYARGDLMELSQIIDTLIAGKKCFDGTTCRELFSKYIASNLPGAEGREVSGQLETAMVEAKRYVARAIAENRTQIQQIGDVAEQAEEGIDPVSLVQSLMTELGKAATRAIELERNLHETFRELDTIRESLKSAEQRANTDTLTGLPNRRAVEEFLRTAQVPAMETGEPLGLLMIDVDHFKRFNDSFGHGVGDQVLRLLAKVLRERLRANDLPGRYGGEELIAVLPGASLAVCESVAERIRRSISECRITRRSTGEELPEITISIGIAQFRAGESVGQLIERCDSALYLAKRNGRNRVITEARLEGRSVA